MSQVSFVSNDERLPELFRACGLKATKMTEAEARTLGKTADAPAVLVLDVRPHHQLAPWVSDVQKKQPGLAIVVIVSTLDARFILEAMRAGIKECLPEPITAQALDEAIRRLVVGEQRERSGQVVAFIGAKGGVGTTTLAVNTAAALAKTAGSPPLLIDLHVARGDAALLMGAEPRFSVLDAFENLHKVDESFLAGLVEKTQCGAHVLASTARPVNVATSPTATRTLLELAARRYGITVLDVPRTDPAMLEALDPATVIAVVTSQELSAVRGAAATVATLRQRYGSQRLRVVINRYDKNGPVSAKDIAKVVGEPVACQIPSDYRAAAEAINVGRPIVSEDGRLAKALRSAAAELVNVGKPAASAAPSVLGRLAWRRA
ncbi:MAG TPA: AAA family ATPase [Vicinamibacterales bacterium]|nr:AAA family ATPase [Vicinamibacterales bacterium]